MILFSWIRGLFADAVYGGICDGLKRAGVEPDDKSEGNPLATLKAHQLAPVDETHAKNGKAKKAAAAS